MVSTGKPETAAESQGRAPATTDVCLFGVFTANVRPTTSESTTTTYAPPSSPIASNNSTAQTLSPSRVSLSPRRPTSERPQRCSDPTAAFLLVLLFCQLATEPLILNKPQQLFRKNIGMTDSGEQSSVRKLFDPMIGEFYADVYNANLVPFLTSKMRYRDDGELAEYAMRAQDNPSVNMMRVEYPLRSAGGPRTRNQPADPSLLDYDAIDQSWRRDIEQEKGVPLEPYTSCQGQGCSSSTQSTDEQYQRDLQILTEKSLFSPLTAEETYQYENLSKAHYADFYRSVPNARKTRDLVPSNNSNIEWLSPSDMKKALGDFEDPSEFFTNLGKESEQQNIQTYNNLTLCQERSDVNLMNNLNLPLMPLEEEDKDALSLPEELKDFQAESSLNLTDGDALELLNNVVIKEDLEDAYWTHEYEGMEMLGEFQNHFPIIKEEPECHSPIPPASHFEEVQNQTFPHRDSSPSSGIGSMRSSGSSPSRAEESFTSDVENGQYLHTRVYNKLAPMVARQSHSSMSSDSDAGYAPNRRIPHSLSGIHQLPQPISVQNGGVQQRKRGRQSKDQQLAMDYSLPASAEEFAAMTHMEIQRFMRDPALSNQQKSLIKKIRRRGRNKVAARKCRERRTTGSESVQPAAREPMRRILNDPANFSLFDY